MMYGVWNRKNGRDKQVLRYYKTWEEADTAAHNYLESELNDPYRSTYWGEPDEYDIVEFHDVYPIDYILKMHCFAIVDVEEFKKILAKHNDDLTKVDEFPFPDDLQCCYKDTVDAIDDIDSDQAFVEFSNGKPIRVSGPGVGEIASI